MIKGIGTDIVEIVRVEKAILKPGFLERYFTESEISQYKAKGSKAQSIAANFAGKEAAAKAMGTGFSGFSAREMEILKDQNGAPFVRMHGKCREICENIGIDEIHISLSHSRTYATAFAVAEGRE